MMHSPFPTSAVLLRNTKALHKLKVKRKNNLHLQYLEFFGITVILKWTVVLFFYIYIDFFHQKKVQF